MKNKLVKTLAATLCLSAVLTAGSAPAFAEDAETAVSEEVSTEETTAEETDAAAEEAAPAEAAEATTEDAAAAETEEATADAEKTAAETEESAADTEEAAPAEEAAEEYEDTGEAPEAPGIVYEPNVSETPKEQAILVVSFGTSFNESRAETICNIENTIARAYPDYDVRRAFTAQTIIDKLAKRDNVLIDNVEQALDRAIDDGVTTLIVQPTHLMNGLEYDDLEATLAEYADALDISLAAPLLTTDDDFTKVAEAITAATKEYDDGQTAICFMGHGTEAPSNAIYEKMQSVLKDAGYANYYVGTVEAEPSLDDVIAAVKEGDYKKVVLEPLMVVAGDHANNDMAGDEDGSWKTTFEAEGYEVECILRGLGSMNDIDALYVSHVQEAIDLLSAE